MEVAFCQINAVLLLTIAIQKLKSLLFKRSIDVYLRYLPGMDMRKTKIVIVEDGRPV